MKAFLFMLPAFVLISCGGVAHVSKDAVQGGTFATSWTSERCQTLLDQRDASIWAAAFGGGLAGVGGLTTAFPENDNVRLGLGISAAVVAAAATSLTVLSKMKSSEFEVYCNLGSPVAPSPIAPGDPVVSAVEREDAPDSGVSD